MAPTSADDAPYIKPADLKLYDAFLFGISTRYGNYPAAWKHFIDQTGPLWASNALCGKYFGLFVSTGSLGGGQESTALASLSSWVHQGMIYVSLGGQESATLLRDLTEVRGGSAWGAGTFAGDGSRMPTTKELNLAQAQGRMFWSILSKVSFDHSTDG